MLTNHIWSVAGEGGRNDVNQSFLQPFLAHSTADGWTFSLNTETS